jgi:stearoyl-CoA desaturase (delta-9 desaturase)
MQQINIGMKIFSASANTITKVQIATGLLSFLGLYYFDFTVTNIAITIISFYVYGVLGIGVTLHRYYTHKNFEFVHPVLKWIFTLFAILAGRASVLGWVYVHRQHHAYSDTDKDPHGPSTIGFRPFGFKHIESNSGKVNVFMIKDLMNKEQIFINDYYYAIILLWLGLLALIDVSLVYFTWIVPVFLVNISQNTFNYIAHSYGYRNYETSDTSTNNFMLWPLVMGDAWHNNHHGNPGSYTTQQRWWEVDPAGIIIRIISKHKQ